MSHDTSNEPVQYWWERPEDEQSTADARDLASGITAIGIDLAYTAGPLMRHLYDAIPPAKQGFHAAQSADLVDVLKSHLRNGDCVMVKGSLGSRMAIIVEALKAHWPVVTEEAA